jgi:hypothetical protein
MMKFLGRGRFVNRRKPDRGVFHGRPMLLALRRRWDPVLKPGRTHLGSEQRRAEGAGYSSEFLT